MKKILLAVCALFMVNAMFAQSYVRTTDAKNVSVKKSTVTGRETAVPENITPMTRSIVGANFMGTTYYDLQTNGAMPQKIVAHEDGTISAVWTTNANTADSRGTGYNYFDGSTWVNPSYSTARIENVRTGWGTLTCVGNAEIVAAHNGSSALVIGICPQKGTQNWTFTNLVGPSIHGINNYGQEATSTALLWPANEWRRIRYRC